MCDSCVASEWKEYRNDFRELKDEDLKQRLEEKAYDDWHRVLSDRVEKLRVRAGFQEEVELVFDGLGGKERQRRQLRKDYWRKQY